MTCSLSLCLSVSLSIYICVCVCVCVSLSLLLLLLLLLLHSMFIYFLFNQINTPNLQKSCSQQDFCLLHRILTKQTLWSNDNHTFHQVNSRHNVHIVCVHTSHKYLSIGNMNCKTDHSHIPRQRNISYKC